MFLKRVLCLLLGLLAVSLSAQTIDSQLDGMLKNHCYLLSDTATGRAALVDAAGPLDSLVAVIKARQLKLDYIIITHAHQDHVPGLPALLKAHPEAKLCMHAQEWKDIGQYAKWREIFGQRMVDAWTANAAMTELMDFDYSRIPVPEILVKQDTVLTLGAASIRLMHTPGHTRGSLTLSFGDALLVGDLLIYHGDGNMDCTLCNGDSVHASIMKLYAHYPDATRVLSGHGPSSTIGYEKKNNRNHRVE